MNREQPRLGRYCFKLWLPLLSVALPILVAEATCRVFRLAPPPQAGFGFYIRQLDNDVEHYFMVTDAQTLWSLKPGYAGPECRVNSAGFRGAECALAKPPNTFRIMCLGDSSTFGLDVSESETYPAQLEKLLNGDPQAGGTRYEVINGGVTGYTSAQCLAMFRSRGYKYQPDLVTVWVGPNDLKKVYTLNDRELLAWRRSRRYLAGSRVRDFLEQFHSYRTISDILRRTAADPPAVERNAQTRVSLEDYRKNLAVLNELCRREGSVLVLISPARRKDNYVRQETIDYRRALAEVARQEHIPLFALVEMTEEAAAPNAAFFLDAVHPNAKGHALIAQRLAKFLCAQGFLKASRAE